jgi:2-polyprenyl-3-methyl-5-hydroxy-6-metoxy-1,4-benzoquinol methylase
MDNSKVNYRHLHSEYMDPTSESYKKLRIVDRFLDKGDLLLDIGIGTGDLIELEKNKFNKIYGLDLEQESIELCKKRFENYADIQIFQENIIKIPELFHQEKFDCCTCLDVLEHIEEKNIPDILLAINRCLKENGVFIFSGPGIFEKLRIILGRSPTHIHSHSSYVWKKMIKSAGFEIIHIETVNFPLLNSDFLRKRCHLFGICCIIVAIKKERG